MPCAMQQMAAWKAIRMPLALRPAVEIALVFRDGTSVCVPPCRSQSRQRSALSSSRPAAASAPGSRERAEAISQDRRTAGDRAHARRLSGASADRADRRGDPPRRRRLFRAAAGEFARRRAIVVGGATRQDSTRLALRRTARRASPETVLIHDAVRPFVEPTLIDRVIAAIGERQALCPPCPSPTR